RGAITQLVGKRVTTRSPPALRTDPRITPVWVNGSAVISDANRAARCERIGQIRPANKQIIAD
ncbi:MAG TPA: hypothetical protein VFU37_11390, partial [Pyrinomonadaceae bacterium]|nr:hypothetical protein [Pyrinomonadaceae bacterium]